MIIGIPRELKANERRVAITPRGVKELTQLGAQVLIQSTAGELSGFSDEEFKAAGAQIGKDLEEVWTKADLLVKVKEPAPEEIQYFRPGLSVFSFLHLAVLPELTKELVNKGVTGLDYDLVMLGNGRLPILEPMSVIAGRLSVQCGAYTLQANSNGRGILLGGAPGVPQGDIVVLGAGSAGSNAAQMALGIGANVTVMDINTEKLIPFAAPNCPARTVLATPTTIAEECSKADVVIGAVLIPGAKAPKLITREILKSMRDKSVLVDISIDQGGVADTSKPTTIADPTYIEEGVIHYCVANMPALVPRTSTIALTNATLPWLKILAEKGIEETLRSSAPMRLSLTSYKNKMVNEEIAKAVGLDCLSADELLKMLN